MDKMLVNAAIEKLTAGSDSSGEAARIIVAACASLPCRNIVSIEASNKSSKNDSFMGHTKHGDVTIKDEKAEETKEWSVCIHKERVGYYKVWKMKEGQLCIQYFWKSDITTQPIDEDSAPPCYYLGYNSANPLYFGVEVKIPLLHFHFLGLELTFYRAEISLIHGELKNRKLYFGLSSVVG